MLKFNSNNSFLILSSCNSCEELSHERYILHARLRKNTFFHFNQKEATIAQTGDWKAA